MSTVTDEITLKVKDELISKFGFTDTTVDLILRERVNSILTFSKHERVSFPSVFGDFVPLGNPPKFMAGYGYVNDEAYLSVFRTQDTAIHLSAKGNKSNLKGNPISLIKSVRNSFRETLDQSKSNPEKTSVKFTKLESEPDVDLIRGLENFDTILYSLLVRKKVVIIGRTEDAVRLLETISGIIPEKFQTDFGFSINLPFIENPSIVIAILDPELDHDIKDKSVEFLENEVDIINLNENACYGQYTCDYTKRIWDIIKSGDELSEAYSIVDEIVRFEEVVNDNETAQQFGDRLNVKYDNADLIIMMRDNSKIIQGDN